MISLLHPTSVLLLQRSLPTPFSREKPDTTAAAAVFHAWAATAGVMSPPGPSRASAVFGRAPLVGRCRSGSPWEPKSHQKSQRWETRWLSTPKRRSGTPLGIALIGKRKTQPVSIAMIGDPTNKGNPLFVEVLHLLGSL